MKSQPVFTISRHGDVLVAALNRDVGNFAEAQIVGEMNRLVERLKAAPVAGVVVDFEHAAYFGSTMLEALRLLWTHLRTAGSRLVLCCVSDVGHEILEVAHFDSVWPVSPTREEAIQVASGKADAAP
ncbi:MAG TPA: STAS domain-containing protein [Planctomycetaceae bacterium]|nr:STAS domain-containing protein [Planctomycetaceae bacterium]